MNGSPNEAMVIADQDFSTPIVQLYNVSEIDLSLDAIAQQLNQRFHNKSVTVITILQGGMVTTAHLLLKLNFLIELDSIHATRYRNQTEGYELEWKQYPAIDLKGKNILIVDDIFDEGVTLSEVKKYCLSRGAQEVAMAVLLEKQHSRKLTTETPDYVALKVPDVYVFGFGLDYHGRYRNASGIYALDSTNKQSQ
ncbi:MAG: hypoxanthine phosphoribosyltransferase [Cellvibrionaceae bacterium]|jgi:hypoxanthine phosphoribosyltransferase